MVVNSRGVPPALATPALAGCGLGGQRQIAGRDLPSRTHHANERSGNGLVVQAHGAEESPVRGAIDDFLEQWRRCLQSDEEVAASPTVYARGVEAGLGGASALLEFIDWRISSYTCATPDSGPV